MKKSIMGLVGAAMLIAATLTAPSAASAEPQGEIWKCRQTRQSDKTINRSQYWSCVWGQILVYSTADSRLLARYDGNCANSVWKRNKRATYIDMSLYCPKDGRPRS